MLLLDLGAGHSLAPTLPRVFPPPFRMAELSAAEPPAAPPSPLSPATADALWKILQRHDHYVQTTHERAPLLMGFNTFVVGGVILQWKTILAQYDAVPAVALLAGVLLAVIALSAVVSLWFVFKTVYPYGTRGPGASGRSASSARSVIFFEDMRRFATPTEYLAAVDALGADGLAHDLAVQTRGLGIAASEKVEGLRLAAWPVARVQLPALALLVVLRLGLTLRR